jgi:hypothetical protein
MIYDIIFGIDHDVTYVTYDIIVSLTPPLRSCQMLNHMAK